jgi:hypothetical protein
MTDIKYVGHSVSRGRLLGGQVYRAALWAAGPPSVNRGQRGGPTLGPNCPTPRQPVGPERRGDMSCLVSYAYRDSRRDHGAADLGSVYSWRY